MSSSCLKSAIRARLPLSTEVPSGRSEICATGSLVAETLAVFRRSGKGFIVLTAQSSLRVAVRPELGGHAVTAWVEDEEGVMADGPEVAVIGGLLCPVHWTLGTVDIKGHALGRLSRHGVLDRGRIEASESSVVRSSARTYVPNQCRCGGEGDTRLPPLARGHYSKRRVFGQPSGAVGAFVTRQPAIDGLAEQIS
jgi:hypothetical protein